MTASNLTMSRAAMLANVVNEHGGSVSARTSTYAELWGAFYNLVLGTSGQPHKTMSVPAMMAAVRNDLVGGTPVSRLSRSPAQLMADIANALGARPQVSALTSSFGALLGAAADGTPYPDHLRGAFHVTIPTATGLSAWEAMTGTPADLMGRFGANTSADTTPAHSFAVLQTYAAELPANRNVHWSLPLAWSTVTMAQVASGSADSFYAAACAAIVAATPAQFWRPIRIGWEMNHPGYAWAASGKATDYINAFRRVAGIVRAAVPNAIIEWCISVGDDNPETYYPGDSYVDVIGGDVYVTAANDMAGGENAYDAFQGILTDGYGLTALAAYATTHSKPLAITEFGIDSNDGYDFIRLLAEWVAARNVLWTMYWDESLVGATDYQDKLSSGAKPKTSAEFVKRFGTPIITTVAAWRVLQNQTWAIPLTSWQTGTWSLVSGSGASVSGSTLTVPATTGSKTYVVKLTTPAGLTATKTITVNHAAAYSAADATAIAFIARLASGTLDEGYKEALDTLCAGLTTDGLLTKLDGLYIFAARAQADAQLNLKGTYGSVTLGGTGVTFTANRGFHGSKTGWLDLGFGGQRGGNVFGQNAASIGGWSLKDFPTDSPFIAQSSYSGVRLRTKSVAGNMEGQINDFTDISAANTDGSGFFIITRTASNARAMRRNTSAIANNTTASTGTNSPNFLGFAEDTAYPNVHEAAVLFIGNGFNSTQSDNLRSRLNTFLTAIMPGFA